MQNVFRERTNLSLQLKDSKTIVGRLQFVLGAMLHALGFFIYLLIFNVSCILAHALCKALCCTSCRTEQYCCYWPEVSNTAFISNASACCCCQTESH